MTAEGVAVTVSRLNLDAPISTVVMTEDFAGPPTILADGHDVWPGQPKKIAVLTKVLNSSGSGRRTGSGGDHRRNRCGIEEV